MHISTIRADSGHSLRVRCDRAASLGTDIQVFLKPGLSLHRRKAAQSPLLTISRYVKAALKTLVANIFSLLLAAHSSNTRPLAAVTYVNKQRLVS